MVSLKIILIVYFIGMIAVGIISYFKIRSVSDYFVSGKSGNLWLISGSLFATIIGGSAILGTIELSQKAGWAAIWFLLSASLGMFVLAWIAPRVSRLGHFTLTEMIRLFYGQRAEKTATLLIPVAWLGIISVQIVAGAKTLAALHIFSYDRAAIVCAAVYIFYTIIGGQKSILKTDLVQAVIILGGLILLFLLRITSLNGQPVVPPGTEPLLNEHFKLTDVLILVLTYSVTFVVGPDIYTRIFCARDEHIARKSALVVAFLLLPVAFLLTFLGISAGKGGQLTGTGELILPGTSYLSPWALGVLAIVMLSAIMSSAATTLMSSSSILAELVTDNLGHKRSMLFTRLFIFLLGGISLWIALRETSILGTLLLSLSFFSGAFILPVLAGIAGWRVNVKMAFAAMISGGFVALAGKIIQEVYGQEWGYSLIVAAFLLNGTLLLFPFKGIFKKQSGQITGKR
jgi:solute:Na+ symporter, SSS family